jgi:hypothetical protein
MFDARAFLRDLESPRKILNEQQALFKGDYLIHDVIFVPKDKTKTLTDAFLRLRIIPKNIWKEKDFIVSVKNTRLKKVGKQSLIPVRKEFDLESDAREYIEKEFSDSFEYSYEFDRIGWQYDLGEDQVDLEDIEGYYSIELKSKTETGLRRLLDLFGITQVIKGPSVVAVKDLLGR